MGGPASYKVSVCVCVCVWGAGCVVTFDLGFVFDGAAVVAIAHCVSSGALA